MISIKNFFVKDDFYITRDFYYVLKYRFAHFHFSKDSSIVEDPLGAIGKCQQMHMFDKPRSIHAGKA